MNMAEPNRTADSQSLRTFYVSTNQSSCNDTFEFGYLVAGLVSECGLAKAYMQYDGSREGKPSVKYANPALEKGLDKRRGGRIVLINRTNKSSEDCVCGLADSRTKVFASPISVSKSISIPYPAGSDIEATYPSTIPRTRRSLSTTVSKHLTGRDAWLRLLMCT